MSTPHSQPGGRSGASSTPPSVTVSTSPKHAGRHVARVGLAIVAFLAPLMAIPLFLSGLVVLVIEVFADRAATQGSFARPRRLTAELAAALVWLPVSAIIATFGSGLAFYLIGKSEEPGPAPLVSGLQAWVLLAGSLVASVEVLWLAVRDVAKASNGSADPLDPGFADDSTPRTDLRRRLSPYLEFRSGPVPARERALSDWANEQVQAPPTAAQWRRSIAAFHYLRLVRREARYCGYLTLVAVVSGASSVVFFCCLSPSSDGVAVGFLVGVTAVFWLGFVVGWAAWEIALAKDLSAAMYRVAQRAHDLWPPRATASE